MILEILENTHEFPNQIQEVGKIFTLINGILEEDGRLFGHMVIDGKEIYEDHQEYVYDHINDIKLVQVILFTYKQMFDNLLISAQDYLSGSLPKTRQLADDFYSQLTKDAWLDLDEFLEGILWLQQMVQSLNEFSNRQQNQVEVHFSFVIDEYVHSFSDALTRKDNVLIGDLLKFEFIPLLESLAGQVSNIVDREVIRHDLN